MSKDRGFPWWCLILGLGWFSFSVRADLILFHDGRQLEGELVGKDGDFYIIKGRFGETRVAMREVKEIRKAPSPRQVAEEKWKKLEPSRNVDDVKALVELVAFSEEHKFEELRLKACRKIITLDPDHAEARAKLGFVRNLGQWITVDRKMELEGKVKVGQQWMTQEEAKAAGVNSEDAVGASSGDAAADVKAARPMDPKSIREQMERLTGISGYSAKDEKQVDCLKCKGTGYSITIPCSICKGSDKPGYKFLGNGYSVCDRCNGAAFLPGAICPLCNKTGKVYLSRILPYEGGTMKPPLGNKWCETCKGLKVVAWDECSKCAKSPWPGYLMYSEKLTICMNCQGQGRIPATYCSTCKGIGSVRIGE